MKFSQRSHIGQREIERWETTNDTFKIRVTAHPEENGGFVGGAYYVFRCAREGEAYWREIMTVRHDDPVKIPREQVRFISDRVGYVFMLYNYAVTVDGGITWFVWYGPEDLPQTSTMFEFCLTEPVRWRLEARPTKQRPSCIPRIMESIGVHGDDYRSDGGAPLCSFRGTLHPPARWPVRPKTIMDIFADDAQHRNESAS